MKLRTVLLVSMLLIAACGTDPTVDSGLSVDRGDSDTASEAKPLAGDPEVVLTLVDDPSVVVDQSRLTPATLVQECLAYSIPNYYLNPTAPNSVPSFLGSLPNWFEVSGTAVRLNGVEVRSFEDVGFNTNEEVVLGDIRVYLDISSSATVGGRQGDVVRVEVPRTVVKALAGDVAAGSSLLIGTLPSGPGTVLSVRPDNTVSSLDCDTGYRVLNDPAMVEELGFENPAEMVRAFTVEGRRDVLEQIETYLGAKEAAEDATRAEANLWVNQDPMRRSVDLFTPPEVLAALAPMSIELRLPDNWPGNAELAVCLRQSFGWGPCVPLTSTFENNTVALPIHIDRTEPLELWFLDADGRFESATRPFQTFEPHQFPEGTGWILSAVSETPPADAVHDAATNTHSIFELTSHT